MNITNRLIAAPVVLAALLFTSGCETAPGTGAGVAAVGGLAGTIVSIAMPNSNLGCQISAASFALGATMETINQISEQQRAILAANAPQTLVVIQHNDAVVKQQKQPAVAQTNTEEKAPRKKKVTPLSVDDVTALAAAGVKPDVIIKAIGESKAVYTPNQIAKAQQASPAVDPSVISYMQKTTA